MVSLLDQFDAVDSFDILLIDSVFGSVKAERAQHMGILYPFFFFVHYLWWASI